MDPPVVIFVLNADPKGAERLGARLADGCMVDLQTAHMSMRGHPSPLFRDRTSFRIANADALTLAREVVAWVETQRAPGTALKGDLVRVVDDDAARAGAPPQRRAPP